MLCLLFIYADALEHEVGGQLVLDAGWIEGDDYSGHGREVRRARAFIAGKMTSELAYEVEYSLTGNNEWKDVYLKYKLSKDRVIQVGNMKEPFGLEALTSSKYNTFMERSLIDTFIRARSLGVMAQGDYADDVHRGTLALGVFGPSLDDVFKKEEGEISVTGRVTYAHVASKESVYHLGLALSLSDYGSTSISLSSDAESHLYEGSMIKTKVKDVESVSRLGIEGAIVQGPFSFQSEYIKTNVSDDEGSYSFSGWYGQASWSLTGEHRKYKPRTAKFSRMKIKKPFSFDETGYGAVELALRISYLDITDRDEIGGEGRDITLGINWYLKSNLRLMSNLVIAEVKEPEIIREKVLSFRFQYDL